MSKQFIINGRFTLDGHALVEAETAEEAKRLFNDGVFEFDHATASMCDWESHSTPKEQ